MRIAWNTHDTSQLAAVSSKGNKIIILDLRKPNENVLQLTLKEHVVTCLQWSPETDDLVLGTEQGRVILWHTKPTNPNDKQISESPAHGEVSFVCWSKANPDWISGVFSSSLHYLHL